MKVTPLTTLSCHESFASTLIPSNAGPDLISNIQSRDWPQIFNNDSTLTSAILDRLLHQAEAILIDGKSYRMKDHLDS